MKRTPLKRKTPLKAKTRLQAKTPLKRTGYLSSTGKINSRSKTRGSMGKESAHLRSRTYLDWVKSQPSCVSGQPADDPHHIKAPGFGGTSKCSDLFTIPLTREEHDEFHRIGRLEWQHKYGITQENVVLRLIEKAIQDGVIRVESA